MKRKTKMKWVLSCLLALVLALSITPSVFAKETDSDTTIYVNGLKGADPQEEVGTTSAEEPDGGTTNNVDEIKGADPQEGDGTTSAEETAGGTTNNVDEIKGADPQEEVGTTSDKAYKMLAAAVAPANSGATIYVDAINGYDTQENVGTASDKAYKTLAKAVAAANSGDTIQLGEGNYTLYGVSSEGHTKEKNLTFIGADTQKTTWNIGTPENDAHGQGNGDFGFQGAKTLIFRNMTLKAGVTPSGTVAGGRDYMGFAHTDKTIVENCVIEAKF